MQQQVTRFPMVVILSVGVFFLAFGVGAVLPLLSYNSQTADLVSVEDLAAEPGGTQFEALVNAHKDQFASYWPDGATPKTYAEVLEMGRDQYIVDGCWQCHTQQVREVDARYGPATTLDEQHHDLMAPSLLGVRRIGPDLSRTGGTRTNEWHLQHFWNPEDVVSGSTMPRYRWYFEEKGVPNDKGFAVITYVQWLGTYQPVASAEE